MPKPAHTTLVTNLLFRLQRFNFYFTVLYPKFQHLFGITYIVIHRMIYLSLIYVLAFSDCFLCESKFLSKSFGTQKKWNTDHTPFFPSATVCMLLALCDFPSWCGGLHTERTIAKK